MTLRHPSPMLPRARGVTDLLAAPGVTPERLDVGLRRVLAARVATLAPGRDLGPVRLDSYTLLQSRQPERSAPSAFRWSPRTSRRLLGLPAARRVILGSASNPIAAARAEVNDVIARSSAPSIRPGALGRWLAEAPHGVLGSVIAEAANYATDLLTALDWTRLVDVANVGRADPVWAVPGAPWVTLRARRDVEITLDDATHTRSLLCVRAGRPDRTLEDDLGFVALADALSRPDAPMPTRVVGLWPSSGRAVSLEVGPETMRRAARLVVEATDSLRRTTGLVAAA